MAVDPLGKQSSRHGTGRAALLWVLPIAFLVGIWLWLVFSSGGYPSKQWVFPAVLLGLYGVAAALLLLYPRRPRQLSLTVVGLLAAYSLWAGVSYLWAGSGVSAWLGSGRTFFYLLVLALAIAYFTSHLARRAFRFLLMLAAFFLLAIPIWRLWTTADVIPLFSAGRLVYPTTDADSTAALFLVLFWPLMWLAAGPSERAPVRGGAVGLATGLLGLAMLTQSRSAAWSLAISLVLFFILSPGRVRLLLYLVVPGLLMVYAAPKLEMYWTLDPGGVGGGSAARTLAVAAVASAFIGMILALLEGWVKVSGRMKVVFGTAVLLGCAAGLTYGAINLTQDTGGSFHWLGDTWRELLSEPLSADPRAADGGDTIAPPTRAEAWSTAWGSLGESPVVGVGADNSGQPPSVVLQVLSDTGIVGAVLAFGAAFLCVGGMLWPRLAVGWGQAGRMGSRWGDLPMAYGWQMALFAGAGYWFVHASLDPLWHVPGVTIPALLMIAAGTATTDARAGILWPQAHRWLQSRTREVASVDPPNVGGRVATEANETASRSRLPGRLRPRGPLSQGFRIGLGILSAAVIIFAATAYLLVHL